MAKSRIKHPREEGPSAILPSKKKADDSSGQGGLAEIDSIFSEKRKRPSAPEEAPKKRPMVRKKCAAGLSSSTLEKYSEPRSSSKWVDDGLGGKFNSEGYTGRVQDGVKVFKGHLLNRPNAGMSKNCPFDCGCCHI